jgi:hypothetical protein
MNEDRLERERIEAGHELARLRCQGATKLIQRDIVDMFYDDGLTPKEALEIQKVRRSVSLGRTFLLSKRT